MVVAADPEADKKLKILIIADNFGQQLEAITSERSLGFFNVASISLIDLTLQWVSSIDADVYIAVSRAGKQAINELKSKWKPYMKVEVLVFDTCHSFGDVMRAVDKLHLFAKEFILIENVPTFCSSNLVSNLEAFRELRKNKTVNGKQFLGKDNLMSILCTQSTTTQLPILLEKSNNRLLAYHPEKSISLTKKQFAGGCVVRSDLKQTGIYFCAPEIITKFSDNIDAQSFTEQIGNILAQGRDNLRVYFCGRATRQGFRGYSQQISFILLSDYETLFECMFSFLHQKYYPSTFGSLHPNINSWQNSIALQFRNNFVFVPQGFEAPIGSNNSVFGGSFVVGEKVKIAGCFFGTNFKIGDNSDLSRVIVGHNVKIGSNAQIKYCIIEDGAELGDNVQFSNCVIFGPDAPNDLNPLHLNQHQQTSRCLLACELLMMRFVKAYGIRWLQEDWSDEERLKSLILEINSSKLAYNIPMDEVTKHIFLVFIQQPQFGPTLNDMKNLTKGWKYIWKNYYKPVESKTQILHAIEEHAVAAPEWRNYAPNFVLYLYNELDLLTDDVIIEWYDALPETNPLKNARFNELIEWLKQEEEDSDESD
ncbi:EIF-2B GDP-GTP exchange factor subunit epsilon [Aphelenchoides bicaudatus]|nr:EIF-2B GDP-GTP exchange factor subunit epsilon [Aphelenchoides bicaudatus]